MAMPVEGWKGCVDGLLKSLSAIKSNFFQSGLREFVLVCLAFVALNSQAK